jgi:GntR family transcriptional regulator
MVNVRLNRQFKVPVYLQLKEQLKSLIVAGELSAGMQLPPAHQLADNLAINRNTVLKAYNELAQEGLVHFRNGVGTFVLEARGDSQTEGIPADMLARLDQAIDELLDGGLHADEIAGLVMARVNLATQRRMHELTHVRAAVFECNLERLTYYERTLRQGLEIEIRPFLITQLEQGAVPAGLAEVDFVTTSFFHFVEVRRKVRQFAELRNLEVFAITVRPHLNVLLELAKLPTGSRVGIVYFADPEYTEQRLQAMVEHIESANLHNIAHLQPVYVQGEIEGGMLAGFDAVLIRPENLTGRRPFPQLSIPVIAYENIIDQAALTMLRRIVHEVRESKMESYAAHFLTPA